MTTDKSHVRHCMSYEFELVKSLAGKIELKIQKTYENTRQHFYFLTSIKNLHHIAQKKFDKENKKRKELIFQPNRYSLLHSSTVTV